MKKIYFIIWLLYLLTAVYPSALAIDKEAGHTAQLLFHSTPKKAEQMDVRVLKVSALLSKYKSPLADYAPVFIQEADKHNIDWKLVVSIAGLESTFGKFIPINSYNAWGWGISTGSVSGINFTDWQQGISTVSQGLKTNYFNKGFDTPEKIGKKYAASPTWAPRVKYFMNQLDNLEIVDIKIIAMNW